MICWIPCTLIDNNTLTTWYVANNIYYFFSSISIEGWVSDGPLRQKEERDRLSDWEREREKCKKNGFDFPKNAIEIELNWIYVYDIIEFCSRCSFSHTPSAVNTQSAVYVFECGDVLHKAKYNNFSWARQQQKSSALSIWRCHPE